MSNSLRVCHSKNVLSFLEISRENGRTKFKGTLAEIAGEVFSTLKHRLKVNFTMQFNHGIGRQINDEGQFDGCIGMLQRNMTDVPLFTVDYARDIPNVTQGSILYEDSLSILSVFSSLTEQVDGDLLYTLTNLDVKMWLACITCLLINCVILVLDHHRSRNFNYLSPRERLARILRQLNEIVVHFICQASVRKKKKGFNMIILMTSLLTLAASSYYHSSIKTELVSIDAPIQIKGYQDIIKYRVTPLWLDNFDHIHLFKEARPSSAEGRLWKYVKDSFKEEDVVKAASASVFGSKLIEAVSGKIALITSNIVLSMLVRSACKRTQRNIVSFAILANLTTEQLDSRHSFISSDPSAQIRPQSVIFNQFTYHSRQMHTLTKRHQGMLEGGFILWAFKQFMSIDLIGHSLDEAILGPVMEERRHRPHMCEKWARSDENNQDNLSNLTVYSLRFLSTLSVLLLVLASVALFLERRFGSFKSKVSPKSLRTVVALF